MIIARLRPPRWLLYGIFLLVALCRPSACLPSTESLTDFDQFDPWLTLERGDLVALRSMLKANPEFVGRDCTPVPGWKPLHVAVFLGKEAVVRELLDAGADPNVTEECGETPLHFAANRNRSMDYGGGLGVVDLLQTLESALRRNPEDPATACRIIQLLLSHGAKVDAADCDGWLPIHYLCHSDKEGKASQVAKLGVLLRDDSLPPMHPNAPNILIFAMQCGVQPEFLDSLARHFPNSVNQKDQRGLLPLESVFNPWPETAESGGYPAVLLAHGANATAYITSINRQTIFSTGASASVTSVEQRALFYRYSSSFPVAVQWLITLLTFLLALGAFVFSKFRGSAAMASPTVVLRAARYSMWWLGVGAGGLILFAGDPFRTTGELQSLASTLLVLAVVVLILANNRRSVVWWICSLVGLACIACVGIVALNRAYRWWEPWTIAPLLVCLVIYVLGIMACFYRTIPTWPSKVRRINS